MGLATVAVFTTIDADAPFVAEADQAVHLPAGYLDIDAVIAAAARTGARFVHPGYGFLSENARFAQAVLDAGLIWVGPSPKVIGTMGDKIAAKEAAMAADVPVLPSANDPRDAESVGFPLLVKASAGGGGKGMRLVTDPADLDEAVAAARREAAGAFGDDRVFLERYVSRARHVEIQILGDSTGTVIHLGERECSIQRRHQKIIEESPSPRVDDGLRSRMGAAALALAESIGYESAGTVEFLVDDDTGEFFFLEVNTRLQVEHPVTEEVLGLDLVREQLLVAAGHALSVDPVALNASGHAIEARLYAEDPENGFLPATGTVEAWTLPDIDGVRWDSGIERGSVVGVDYDPMLAKVIAHAPTRVEAATLLARGLESLHLGGLVTNRDFLVSTLRTPEFLAGDTTTDFVERVAIDAETGPGLIGRAAIVAALWLQAQNRRSDNVWGFAPSNWRNGGLAPSEISLNHRSLEDPVTLRYRADRNGRFTFLASGDTDSAVGGVQDGATTAEIVDTGSGWIEVLVDGLRQRHRVTESGESVHVQTASTTVSFIRVPRFVIPGSEAPSGGLVAPMPGKVVEVRCAVGDVVEVGQVLVVLEAMKMEHHVQAPAAGIIGAVLVAPGEQLTLGTPLVTIEESDATSANGMDGEGTANG